LGFFGDFKKIPIKRTERNVSHPYCKFFGLIQGILRRSADITYKEINNFFTKNPITAKENISTRGYSKKFNLA